MVHVIFAFSILISAVCIGKGDKRRYLCKLSFIILFAFAALRYNYGSDYVSYFRKYCSIKSGHASPYKMEYIFTLLNRISPSYYVLIAITSAVFVYAIYRLITKNLDENLVWFGLFILLVNPYLYLMNLSAIRQCMAMVLLIAAVPFANKRKAAPYFFLIVLSVMCHKSAIIMLPLYFILNDRQIKKSELVIWTAVILVLISFGGIVGKLLDYVVRIFDDSNYVEYFSSGKTNSLRSVLLSSIFYVYVIINIRKLSGVNLAYAKLYLIGISLSLVAYRASMLTRPEMYFDIFSVVVLPNMLKINREIERSQAISLNKSYPAGLFLSNYVLPTLMITVYLLRYYSFFTNPLWVAFTTYHTIIGA